MYYSLFWHLIRNRQFHFMNKFFKYFFFIFLGFFIVGCKSAKKMDNFTDKDLRFSMSKGVCFGTCPVYELKIYHGGYATFVGKQNTDRIGMFDKELSKKDYKKVVKIFEKMDFDSYPSQFKTRIPDLPTIQIGYHNGEQFRIVTGKEDRPEDLMQAQFLLEKIVDNHQWNFVKSLEELNKNTKPEPSFIYNEIIIEPKKGLLLPRWLKSKNEYGVRLVKKIAPALNYYLIEFDTQKINPNKFIDMLYKDKDIKSAEFNKKMTQRGR